MKPLTQPPPPQPVREEKPLTEWLGVKRDPGNADKERKSQGS